MSKVAVMRSTPLLHVLQDISSLLPKGSTTLPIGIVVRDREIQFTTSSGIAYTTSIGAEDTIPVSVTVLYSPLEPFIEPDSKITLDIGTQNVTLSSGNFRAALDLAYSTVEPLSIPKDAVWQRLGNFAHAVPGLKTLTSTGLSTYYKKEQPVSVYKDVSAIFYPNVRLQVRTPNLSFQSVLPAEHCKLLMRFLPEEYCIHEDWIFFKRDATLLVLPYRPVTSGNLIPDIVRAMSAPVTLQMGKYADKIKALSKLKYLRLTIVMYTDGIMTQSFGKGTAINIPVGDVSGLPLSSFIVPTDLWYMCIRMLKSDTYQVLFNKEGLICLRTQSETIVLRAIC